MPTGGKQMLKPLKLKVRSLCSLREQAKGTLKITYAMFRTAQRKAQRLTEMISPQCKTVLHCHKVTGC
jgi:hypothetical protein